MGPFIRKNIDSPEDTSSNCVNYPTDKYRSFSDCDQDFIKKTLPEGLVPFWSVTNLSLASDFYKIDHLSERRVREVTRFHGKLI